MKLIFGILISFFSVQCFSKSIGLTGNFSNGFYSLEYQLMPKRTVGILYNSLNQYDDNYKYEGSAYGLSLSTKDFTDELSIDLFLAQTNVARSLCTMCTKENMTNYIWGFSAQKNWVWDWGLYIYVGFGFRFQNKTYDYRRSSFIGPQVYIPLGLGLAF